MSKLTVDPVTLAVLHGTTTDCQRQQLRPFDSKGVQVRWQRGQSSLFPQALAVIAEE